MDDIFNIRRFTVCPSVIDECQRLDIQLNVNGYAEQTLVMNDLYNTNIMCSWPLTANSDEPNTPLNERLVKIKLH